MALIDKDQVKAEIRRRLSLIYLLEGDFTDGSRDAYEGLLSWLDTLPEQSASEEERILNDISLVVESSATKYLRETGQMPEWYDRIVAYLEKRKEQKPVEGLDKAGRALVDAVERHCAPQPGQEYCLRSELLNTKETFKKLLK